MARWKLLGPHYLNTDPPIEIEFKETDRNTGKQARKVYKVPRYMDPKDPSDCNRDGDCVVCNGTDPLPGDIVITDEPTPDMEAIDAEAKKISAEYWASGKWTKKEEGMDFGESLIKKMMDRMDAMNASVPAPGVDAKAFADLQAQVKALMEQNAKLTAERTTVSRRL
jgi:hypothetical protein